MFVIPNNILDFLNTTKIQKGPIVVGVSGGADSMYLTHILDQWCQKNKRTLLAITINHGLRSEAQKEADWVHTQLNKNHINHEILHWNGPKPKTRIEERAREKRYQLMLHYCHQHKAAALFLAHHMQDQTETFWARLAHSSGLDGLTAMAPISYRNGIMLIRPLLNTPKTEIINALTKNKIKWAEDPMNQDLAYERVQWRHNQQQLDKMGLTCKSITKTVERLQRAKDALNIYTEKFLAQNLKKSSYGFLQLDENAFMQQPLEIRVRTTIIMLKMLNKTGKIISLDSVEQLASKMPKSATLSGCQWVISHHQIFLAPELRYCPSTPISRNEWNNWGGISIWTNCHFIAQAKAPSPRLKQIPYLIQRTFLKIPKGYKSIYINEKELEKNIKLDYKDKAPIVIIKLNEQKEKA